MTTNEFIRQYRDADVRKLALQGSRYPDVDMGYALEQIQGWQTALQKLPSWAACDGVVYPPHLSMEQCSSEPTAQYKKALAERWLGMLGKETPSDCATYAMTDLTGGFGVDFSYVSRPFGRATYVERNERLCRVAEHNLPCLGLGDATVVCGEAEAVLDTMEPQTMLFLDPARRDRHGAKTVMLADCSPDVVQLLPRLLAKSRFVMLKLSPMLDWHKAVADLQGAVREVHIVSVGGECKELLLVLSSELDGSLSVHCVDIVARKTVDGTTAYSESHFTYTPSAEAVNASCTDSPAVRPVAVSSELLHTPNTLYLYEPNASIMKAGCFGEVERAFGVSAISPNSHLFLAEKAVADFPGRSFVVDKVTTLNKRELRQALAGIEKANIATRNFPLSVVELRKRLKLKDGGAVYLFATTTADGAHILLVAHRTSFQ